MSLTRCKKQPRRAHLPAIPAYDTPPGDDVRWPQWAAERPLEVLFSANADAQIAALSAARGGSADVRPALQQVLAADPRPVYRWRRQQQQGKAAEYDVDINGARARCRFEVDESVTVLSCEDAGGVLHPHKT